MAHAGRLQTGCCERDGNGRSWDHVGAPKRNEPPSHELWANGFWQGPRDLRVFVRHNRGFPWFYLVFYGAAAGVISWVEIERWYAFPIAVAIAAGLTLVQTFLFSRGWLGNASGD
jgi:hypothetical protein